MIVFGPNEAATGSVNEMYHLLLGLLFKVPPSLMTFCTLLLIIRTILLVPSHALFWCLSIEVQKHVEPCQGRHDGDRQEGHSLSNLFVFLPVHQLHSLRTNCTLLSFYWTQVYLWLRMSVTECFKGFCPGVLICNCSVPLVMLFTL